MSNFKLQSKYSPAGDQPKAIDKLVAGLNAGMHKQTLLGITGSGKTFTMANVIARVNKPTLVIAHNKTLAAQLCNEFRELFPENAVHYFVSYYDYYQPEAYMPVTDTYIEKEAMINEEIDRLRHAATMSLLTRRDVIVVASVSCIYGLGAPELYKENILHLAVGDILDRATFIKKLVSLQFKRTNSDLLRGTFRVRGAQWEIMPANEELIYRVRVESDSTISELMLVNPVEGVNDRTPSVQEVTIAPAKHFITDITDRDRAIKDIQKELKERLAQFEKEGKLLEAERLERRTKFDLAMIREVGYCNGIENYSMHLSGRKPGDSPDTLLSYFPNTPHPQPLPQGEGGAGYQTTDTKTWYKLQEAALEMRKNPTPAEEILWNELRRGMEIGVRFRRQQIIGRFIVDFVCLPKMLVIEVDGDIHDYKKADDDVRTEYLSENGYTVVRFKNDEVQNNLNDVVLKINDLLKTLPDVKGNLPPSPPLGGGARGEVDEDSGGADFLTIIDESHITLPQLSGMFNGDAARKKTLVDYGFRLPSAKENRPLRYDEFVKKVGQVVYTSATPGETEIKESEQVVEQIIRPTGLIDPEIVLLPAKGQIDDLKKRLDTVIEKKERIMITTLTKKMAEDLSAYLEERKYKAAYLHSDVKTFDRIRILTEFRRGKYDVLVGVNLLREGLDLPEVSLVAILDADKEGFLRSETSLIQTIGRAARNVAGQVILYGDIMTGSMQKAVDVTNRRRALQMAYNKEHGITPKTIIKEIKDILPEEVLNLELKPIPKTTRALEKLIKEKEREMKEAAKQLDFELAALLRDEVKVLIKELHDIGKETKVNPDLVKSPTGSRPTQSHDKWLGQR